MAHTVVATTYNVRMNTSALAGRKAAVAFDLTSNNLFENTASIYQFAHDGVYDLPETQGGLVTGDIILGLNPAYYTVIQDNGPTDEAYNTPFFYNQLVVHFNPIGRQITFSVDLSEYSYGETSLFDELSFFLLQDSLGTPVATADSAGANALFAWCVTGAQGGELSVFAPMQFIPPDTLAYGEAIVGVQPPSSRGRLHFRSVSPNPTKGVVRFEYEVPAPGGEVELSVFDMTGRLVQAVERSARPAGTWETTWTGDDHDGHHIASGVYIVRLHMAGQSVVRRVVVAR
jgi:hypothetical protein